MLNQPEVDSWDQHKWRAERQYIYQTINTWCSQNQVTQHNSINNLLADTRSSKMVYKLLFDLLPSMSQWQLVANKCNKTGQQVFVITDNLLTTTNLGNVHFISVPEFLGSTASYNSDHLTPVNQTKLFSCFMQRADANRQTWLYFLHNYKLLDCGYVSFLLKQLTSYSALTGIQLFDYIHHTHKLNELPQFDQAYNELRNLVPYRNFEETLDLLPYITSSKYSLILETYSQEDSGGIWCYTEKSLRDLQLPVIPLLFWQKGASAQLKKIGFELPEYADSIDQLPWQARQQALLDILINDSIDNSWNNRYERACYNRNLLSEWKQKYHTPEFFNLIFEKISNR